MKYNLRIVFPSSDSGSGLVGLLGSGTAIGDRVFSFSFLSKRRSFQSSCQVRAKSTRDSHGTLTSLLGQLVFRADSRRGIHGTLVDKDSHKVHQTSQEGKGDRWWVFPVLFTISQGFLIRASSSYEQFTGLVSLFQRN